MIAIEIRFIFYTYFLVLYNDKNNGYLFKAITLIMSADWRSSTLPLPNLHGCSQSNLRHGLSINISQLKRFSWSLSKNDGQTTHQFRREPHTRTHKHTRSLSMAYRLRHPTETSITPQFHLLAFCPNKFANAPGRSAYNVTILCKLILCTSCLANETKSLTHHQKPCQKVHGKK